MTTTSTADSSCPRLVEASLDLETRTKFHFFTFSGHEFFPVHLNSLRAAVEFSEQALDLVNNEVHVLLQFCSPVAKKLVRDMMKLHNENHAFWFPKLYSQVVLTPATFASLHRSELSRVMAFVDAERCAPRDSPAPSTFWRYRGDCTRIVEIEPPIVSVHVRPFVRERQLRTVPLKTPEAPSSPSSPKLCFARPTKRRLSYSDDA